MESLLQPFREQSATIRSIVAVGCHLGAGTDAALLRLIADEDSLPAIIVREPIQPTGLASLARLASELAGSVPGNDLLLLPEHVLNEMMAPLASDFSFRAVVALWPQAPDQVSNGNDWKLRRSLFDRGLICVGSVPVAGCKALCFLASDAVRSLNHLDIESRGYVTAANFLVGAGFANELFRYACLKLYALRHGVTAAFPAWEGQQLFGLHDKSCEGLDFPRVTYLGFDPNDRELWDKDDPPINIDLDGYFQEIPECWRRHRPLLRRLFELSSEHVDAIDAWRRDVTNGGRRTLVAIHLRRGRDYRTNPLPQFRLVPEDWYLDWLSTMWPTVREPLLFVGTDEPDEILPMFQKFETTSATFDRKAIELPDHVCDFEIMRRADYLVICNSSFSRMAAILAPSTQKCFIPSFHTQSVEPYEPWIDPDFWPRFAG